MGNEVYCKIRMLKPKLKQAQCFMSLFYCLNSLLVLSRVGRLVSKLVIHIHGNNRARRDDKTLCAIFMVIIIHFELLENYMLQEAWVLT